MHTVIKSATSSARWKLGGAMLIVVAAVGMAGPGIALSATNHGTSAASDQYNKPAKAAVAATSGSSSGGGSGGGSFTPPAATSSSGTLPFTGVSLVWPAIGAFALVGLGLFLRRHERDS